MGSEMCIRDRVNTAPTMQDIIKEEKQAEKVPVDDFDPMSM